MSFKHISSKKPSRRSLESIDNKGTKRALREKRGKPENKINFLPLYLLWKSLERFLHPFISVHSLKIWIKVKCQYILQSKQNWTGTNCINKNLPKNSKGVQGPESEELLVVHKVSLKLTFISENKKVADTLRMKNFQEIYYEWSREPQAIKCNIKPFN